MLHIFRLFSHYFSLGTVFRGKLGIVQAISGTYLMCTYGGRANGMGGSLNRGFRFSI